MKQRDAALRSLLFVPGGSPRKLAKAAHVPSDALVVDWEDAVAPETKAQARGLTQEFLCQPSHRSLTILIRFNSVRSGQPFLDDCAAFDKCAAAGIMLSKCESIDDIHVLAARLDRVDPHGDCRIYPLIESPLGLLNAFSIASASVRVAALCLGAEDFCAETGIMPGSGEIELLHARSALIVAARAAGQRAIDSASLEFHNLKTLGQAAHTARRLGFSGKLAIHPAQVPTLNSAFSPSESEKEAARSLLQAASSESGAFVHGGRMVDEAVLRRARSVLELASQVSLESEGRCGEAVKSSTENGPETAPEPPC